MGEALQDRLQRLLFLVPYVAKHPGRTVSEVAGAAGISREQLLEELELLTLVGRPPFQPDDFIDIYVEDERVYVELDQRLSAPPRLTAAEGVALGAAAATLKPMPDDTLGRALAKLEAALPPAERARAQTLGRSLDVSFESPPGLTELSAAIIASIEVRFDYVTPGRGQHQRRHVQPHELFNHRGHWYLNAHCMTRGDERLFRIDRMRALEVTTMHFTAPPKTAAKTLPTNSETQTPVRVRFTPQAGRYIVERFQDAAQRLSDGSVEVTVAGDSLRWLTGWVLSFGGEAVVLEPDWAVKAITSAAQAALSDA